MSSSSSLIRFSNHVYGLRDIIGNHWTRTHVQIRLVFALLLSSCVPVSNVPSRDWSLIDYTINLILGDEPPASRRRRAPKVERPSISGCGQLNLHSLRSRREAQSVLSSLRVAADERGGPPSHGPSGSLPGTRLAWPGGQVEGVFDRPALAPRAGYLCYKMPPRLM